MGAAMRALESQIVLITGATGGHGAEITKAFLEVGTWVVGSSRKITGAATPVYGKGI